MARPPVTNIEDVEDDDISINSVSTSPHLEPLQRWPAYLIFSTCACMLGLSSWITINATWTELPVLTSILPEGLSLPSYIILITQIANIGPFVYTTLVLKYGERFRGEAAVIWLILLIGLIASLALAFVWCHTTVINGRGHSLALLFLLLMLSIVDCTSSVSFVPHIAVQWPTLLLPYFIGEGLCALVPSLLALVQDIERSSLAEAVSTCSGFKPHPAINNPSASVFRGKRFSVRVYFLIVSGLLFVSLISFTMLVCWRRWRLRMLDAASSSTLGRGRSDLSRESSVGSARTEEYYQNVSGNMLPVDEDDDERTVLYPPKRRVANNFLHTASVVDAETMPLMIDAVTSSPRLNQRRIPSTASLLPPRERLEWTPFLPFGFSMSLIAFMAVGMLQVQSFSTAAYGPQVYLYAATASQVANPIGRLLTVWWCPSRLRTVNVVCAIMLIFSVYFSVVAVLRAVSAKPEPLLGQAGAVIMIMAWFLFALGAAFSRVVLIKQLQPFGRKALVSVGAAYQIGAAFGAVILFVIIKLFACFVANDTQQCGW